MSRSPITAGVLAALAAAALPLAAQVPTRSGAYVTRLGNDTVFVERFTRTDDRLEGEQLSRTPRALLRRYVVEFGPGGAASRLELNVFRPPVAPDAGPVQRITATFANDTAIVETQRGDSTRAQRFAVPSAAVPILGTVWALYDEVIERSRRARDRGAAVRTYAVGAPRADSVVPRWAGGDSLGLQTTLGTWNVRLDPGGRLQRLNGFGTTQQYAVDRQASVDFESLVAQFAARDAQGQALGQLSPRDTLRAVVAGAHLMVDYGRPRKRGRVIFGDVVPWGAVWRTGANAATQFRTDRDVVMAGVTIPAGTYTLWALPSQTGWKLIVNRQVGQWGTQYDPAHDLARLDLRTQTLPTPVEVFTIEIGLEETGGVLRLEWDTVSAWIPFTVR